MIISFGNYVTLDTEKEYGSITVEPPSRNGVDVETAEALATAIMMAVRTARNQPVKESQ